ncbi:hypothetical protein [Streptomyces sp. NPDC055189]
MDGLTSRDPLSAASAARQHLSRRNEPITGEKDMTVGKTFLSTITASVLIMAGAGTASATVLAAGPSSSAAVTAPLSADGGNSATDDDSGWQ